MLKFSTYINVAEWPASRATLIACSVSASAAWGWPSSQEAIDFQDKLAAPTSWPKRVARGPMLGRIVERDRAIEMRSPVLRYPPCVARTGP